ncbi:MAG: Holliday junction branch migration DNA helicase RuvB [Limisphaerales bacterium]|nr:Holliday junction branch migration DNA helicase RuvB [Verrucomicrobiota bacterium]MEC8719498.1 Holliday junction branch migration DNA helicase RuvB [Verrucomicrobiota bacterium]HCB96802.1 Holliday junction branch migration DNA helicase RuvB [Verrucomicrobiales bacterium]
MMHKGSLGSLVQPEEGLEMALRPPSFADFTGQAKVKDRLEISIQAAKQRKDILDHILLSGPPGLGKTTLASIMAHEMGTRLKTSSGPSIEKVADLAGILTNLEEGDVLFIDEIHSLNKAIEEYLYPAMEDFQLDIVIDQGPNARSIRLDLPKFTLIGATTRSGLLSAPLLSRFTVKERLDHYTAEELTTILLRSSRVLEVPLEGDAALKMAECSRGTPRIANNLLRRVRDYAQVRHDGVISVEVVRSALEMLEIDANGLNEMDKRILRCIAEHFGGGPVGIKTMALAVGEEPETIEHVHEPFLISKGLLSRTPQGRILTPNASRILGAQ